MVNFVWEVPKFVLYFENWKEFCFAFTDIIEEPPYVYPPDYTRLAKQASDSHVSDNTHKEAQEFDVTSDSGVDRSPELRLVEPFNVWTKMFGFGIEVADLRY